MDSQAFYTQTGPGEFDSSPLTAGPWSAASQHGGPPSALLAREITKRIQSEVQYPGQIKVTVLRETRFVEYAK